MEVAIRFDVDTEKCLKKGVPALLEVARERGVKFSFMINMGRAISYSSILAQKISSQSPPGAPVDKLSPLRKLGIWHFLRTILINPKIGVQSPELLHLILEDGHVIGLHGGRNHGAWQAGASTWSREKLIREVEWGIKAFQRVHLPEPSIFSSPGWNSPDDLPDILSALGFSAIADSHNPGECIKKKSTSSIDDINTSILGNPGAIGFIEHCVASSKSVKEAVEITLSELNKTGRSIVYDHPFFAGCEGLDYLSSYIDLLGRSGVAIISLDDL